MLGGLCSILRALIVLVTVCSPLHKKLFYALLPGIISSFCLGVGRSPLGTRGQTTRSL